MRKNIVDLDWLTSDVNVRIQLFDGEGRVKEDMTLHNLVTNAGKDAIATRIRTTTPAAPTHMAVGTGTGGNASATALIGTELHRKVFDAAIGQTGATLSMETTFAAGEGTGAITEAGVFNNSSGGTMYMYAFFAAINKAAADTLKITWTLGVV